MKVSLNLVKKFTKVSVPTLELIDLIGSKLGAIEEVIDLGQRYQGALIVRVVESDRHPNADKLSVCKIDDGQVTKNIERDEHGLIQVVCGAPNVRKDMLAVWLKPGSIVPSTFGKDSLILEPKELRGIVSQGMLASSKELGLSDEHHGILELDKPAKIGQEFAEVYELNDVIIDIENKMLTHRPDCFGVLGIAREIAGITGEQFKSPDWYTSEYQEPIDFQTNNLIQVENKIPELVAEFLVQIISGIEIKPSDVQTQSFLSRSGIRPINNVVDQTNFYMLITGQPLHAYDYDKLKSIESSVDAPKIVIRKPNPDEQVDLLNGKRVTPSQATILITTGSKAIGLGGVMGGSSTEIDNSTKNIVLECATFDMYTIRRTSMENGIFSEAVTRFNKGQSSLQNIHILPIVSQAIVGVAGGQIEGSVLTANKNPSKQTSFPVEVKAVNNLLGLDIEMDEMIKLLTNVEIDVSGDNDQMMIKPPFWRTDLEIREDVIEEVGRLYGYDRLRQILPVRSSKPVAKNKLFEFRQKIRELMLRAGANEAVTYNFVHGNLIENVNQNPDLAYKLSNALSPDIQYYRLSLAPSLLEKIHSNVKTGYSKFVLYEMSKIVENSFKDHKEPTLPEEQYRIAMVLTDNTLASSAAYYQAKTYLGYLMTQLGIEIKLMSYDQQHIDAKFVQTSKIFEPIRSGLIYVGDVFLGIIGEPTQSIKKIMKLPDFVSIIELDLAKLLEVSNGQIYSQLSHYPKIEQDVCFRVPTTTKYSDLYNMTKKLIAESFEDAYFNLSPVDIFQGESSEYKQITLRVSLNSYSKTLKSSDLRSLMSNLKARTIEDFSGDII